MDLVEERLVAALREHAEGEVDTTALLHGASAAGERLKRRRRVGALAAVAASVAVAVGVVAGVFGGIPSPESAPPATREHSWTMPPALPMADGEPSAEQDPSVVSSDPRLLHLSLDELPLRQVEVWYSSWDMVEKIELVSAGQRPSAPPDTSIMLSKRPPVGPAGERREPGKVGSHDAILYREGATRGVRWQPAPGLWAEVHGVFSSPDDLIATAEAVRLDRVHRCVTPLRLTWAPEGARFSRCVAVLGEPDLMWGRLVGIAYLKGSGKSAVTVAVLEPGKKDTPKPNTRVAGVPARWEESNDGTQRSLHLFGLDGQNITVTLSDDYSKADAVKIAEGIRLPENLKDPRTWPLDPLG